MPETRKYSHELAWAILIVAGIAMLATMDKWIHYLDAILGGLILGALLATLQGHLLNGAPFSRYAAGALTILAIGSSLLSKTIAKRSLSVVDRIALTGFVISCMIGFYRTTAEAGLIGIGLGFVFLLAAWVKQRYFATE